MHKVFTTLDKVGSKFEVREIIMSVQKKQNKDPGKNNIATL